MNQPPTFDDRAATWDDDPRKLARAAVVAEAIREGRECTHWSVLDFGAGTGLLGMHFVQQGAAVTFVDPSAEMRKQVERKLRASGDSHSSAVDSLTAAGDGFDLVAALMALHHVEDPAVTIVNLAKRLRSGGRLALCDLEPEDGSFHDPGTTGVHHGFSREQLAHWCQDAGLSEFRCETLTSIERESEQGVRRYPLFLMVAMRRN